MDVKGVETNKKNVMKIVKIVSNCIQECIVMVGKFTDKLHKSF